MSKSRAFLPNLIKLFTTSSSRDQNEGELERIAAREPKEFSFKTLVAATRNFDSSLKLGEGGFGPVYKGKLDDGREVAIKKLSQTSAQGKKEFQIEVKLLARVQHKNVVTLLGYFVQSTEMLLVYEYVANESLDKLLFKSGRREILDWKRRYNVMTGVAKGLLYLHQEAPSRIIHRDIKASNILLDDKWVPKIADFGMARLYSEDKTHVNTRVAGTNGYTAPEYLMHGHLSEKSDVFSFGVVLLELISGQKNSKFKQDLDPRNLLEWAYQLYKKQRSLEMMDNTLVSSADLDQVSMCIHIGLLCVQSDPKSRPDMGRVVLMLSKWPAVLEEPMRPGYPGSMYRMSDKLVPSSSATLSSSSQSSATLSSSQLSFGSSTNSSATSSSHPRGIDSHENLPAKD